LCRTKRTDISRYAVTPSADGPVRATIASPDLCCHDGTAIVQIEPDPIPADCRFIEQLARPFVIEPCSTLDAMAPTFDRQHTRRGQMRQAVVVASRQRIGPFLAEAVLSLQKRRLRRTELELDHKVCSADRRAIDITFPTQRPVIDVHGETALLGFGQAEAGARRTFCTQQRTLLRIADRSMRKQQLLRRKARRIVFVEAGAGAEEGDLEATFHAGLIFHPACDVPPFGAKLRMTALVLWKGNLVAGHDIWILDFGRERAQADNKRDAQCDQRARA